MLIQLGEDCSLFEPENRLHLTKLLFLLAEGRHILITPTPGRLVELIDPSLWSVFGDVIVRQYTTVINSRQSISRHPNCSTCPPAAVGEYYSMPLTIIVENVHTDGHFIEMVAEKVRPRLSRCFRGANPLVKFEQAGGIGEIPKMLTRTIDRHHPKQLSDAKVRVIAVSDSDARQKDSISADAREVVKKAKALGAASHVLKKRSIENYFPDDALVDYAAVRADRTQAVQVITKLKGDARDYYPMKTGLEQRDLDELDLYVPQAPLAQGMGDFAHDLMANFNHVVKGESLKDRDGVGELERLLDSIEEYL